MRVFEAIEKRRSVKSFDPDHRLSEEEEKLLSTLVPLSPTAFNIQNWRFVVIKDPSLREQIRAAAWGQTQVTDASLLVVLCADLKAWEKQPERYWADADQSVQEAMIPMIDAYYRDKEQVQRDEAMRSCGLAGQTLMLAAKAMGYDSCPMDGFDYDQVGELINLPEDHIVAFMVAVGKPLEEAHTRAGQLPIEEVRIYDRFG